MYQFPTVTVRGNPSVSAVSSPVLVRSPVSLFDRLPALSELFSNAFVGAHDVTLRSHDAAAAARRESALR